MSDPKFAFRQLLKNPGFAAVAVLTLALGIGASTAIYSVVNVVLFNPLPGPASDRLIQIAERTYTAGAFGQNIVRRDLNTARVDPMEALRYE